MADLLGAAAAAVEAVLEGAGLAARVVFQSVKGPVAQTEGGLESGKGRFRVFNTSDLVRCDKTNWDEPLSQSHFSRGTHAGNATSRITFS